MIDTQNLKGLFNAEVQFHDNLAIITSTSELENQEQTNQSFSEKWVKLDEQGSTEAGEIFQKEWALNLYGFGTEQGLREFLSDKKVIIDAGCGLGYKSAWLADNAPGAIVIGIDFSEAAYVAARRYKHIPNLYFLRADIANLPLKKGSIDFVLC